MTATASHSTSAASSTVMESVAYALIGAAVELPRCLPRLVSEQVTRQRVKIDQQITLARFLGKMAVTHAQSEIRRRVTASNPTTSNPVTPTPATESPSTSGARDSTLKVVAAGETGDAAITATLLAIEHYDELSASQVLQRLVHLDAAQLAMIHEYESAHRRRRTVLGRVEQLRARGVVG
jgi:hypothetical protein